MTRALASEIRSHFGLCIDGKEEEGGRLANEASLFEAEITGSARSRGTDNHVIQHLNLQDA